MARPCPKCNSAIELVQSAPVVILLCRKCGIFYNYDLERVGDTTNGLDMDMLEGKRKSIPVQKPVQQPIPEPVQQAMPEPVPEPPLQQPEIVQETPPAPKGETNGSIFDSIEAVRTGMSGQGKCPQCGSESIKTSTSRLTGMTMRTCTKCGYTGSMLR